MRRMAPSSSAPGWLRKYTTSSGGMGTTSSSARTTGVPRRGLPILVGGAFLAGAYLLFSKGENKPRRSGPLPPKEGGPPVSAETKMVDSIPDNLKKASGIEPKE